MHKPRFDKPPTPPLHNTRQHNLFRVVGNKGGKLIDDATKMTIGTFAHHWYCHGRFEGSEDSGDGVVVELLFEDTKIVVVVVFSVSYNKLISNIQGKLNGEHAHLGIARKPIGITAFR